jgi:hydrogenase nickel incorporation protein HypA/HybF
MHELSVASAIVNTAAKHAGSRPVSVVSVRVGALRQVVPDSLLFYFEIVARDGVCEGARLELTEVPLRLHCLDCDDEWEPEYPDFRCPRCSPGTVEAMSGEELEVDYIEVEEEAACIARR